MSSHLSKLTALMDHVIGRFNQGEFVAATGLLVEELRMISLAAPRAEWLEELAPACRHHPLHSLLLQDPYTRRAFEKPRGYAGDAEMLDYIYNGLPPDETTGLGRDVFHVTTGGPNGQSVIARRDFFAERIDAASQQTGPTIILSVGCGHLREAQQAHSVRAGWNGLLYALDQDEQSLAVVECEQSRHGVRTICCPVGSLIRGQPQLGELSLVYASGLFDYLTNKLAARLVRSLFGMLRVGGRLIVANFAPDNHGRAYMESFMDWSLICRDGAGMEELSAAVPKEQIAERSVYHDAFRNIIFLELVRHDASQDESSITCRI